MSDKLSVKFLIAPDLFPVEVFNIPLNTKLEALKKTIARDLKQADSSNIQFTFQDQKIQESYLRNRSDDVLILNLLSPINIKSYRTLNIVVTINLKAIHNSSKERTLIKANKPYRVSEYIKKSAFEGGYRNIETGAILLNAGCQARKEYIERESSGKALLVKKEIESLKQHNSTQTKTVASRTVQGKREIGTQAKNIALFIDEREVTSLNPKKYFLAEEMQRIQLQTTLKIQCFWRNLKAKREVQGLLEQKLEEQSYQLERFKRATHCQKSEDLRGEETLRNPESTADFEQLNDLLVRWKQEKLKAMQSTNDPNGKLHALELEVIAQQILSRFKQRKLKERVDPSRVQILKTLSEDNRIITRDQDIIRVETPNIRNSTRLLNMFEDLRSGNKKKKHESEYDFNTRWLETLVELQWLLKEKNYSKRVTSTINDLSELIERETEFLRRGRGDGSNRPGQEKRILSLFYKLCLNEEFNPEAKTINRSSD